MRTLTVSEVYSLLGQLLAQDLGDKPVRLIVGGIAYAAPMVWYMPNQGKDGSVCMGDDPR